MFKDISKKLLETIKNGPTEDFYFDEDNKKIAIKNEDFINILDLKENPIAYIDGGNAEIIGAANFSLNLIRVSTVMYNGTKKIMSRKMEFFALITAERKNGSFVFKSTILNSSFDMNKLEFDFLDRSVSVGSRKADLVSVANAIRRFAELRAANDFALDIKANIIVLDGALEPSFTGEGKFLDELFNTCKCKDILLVAISKTNSQFCESARPISMVLNNLSLKSGKKTWLYPISNKSKHSYFVKLHEKSRHVFKLDALDDRNIQTIASSIRKNSSDPVFFGYPFGLVEADRLARVTNEEKSSLRSLILASARDINLEKYATSQKAHGVLDKISF